MPNNIQYLLKQRGLTIPQLSKAAGLNSAFVYRLAKAEQIPEGTPYGSLKRLAAALEVTINDLETEEPMGKAKERTNALPALVLATSLAELISDNVRFVTEGDRQVVQLDLATWEELLTRLEDLEDAAELEQARKEDDELIPWGEVQLQYLTTE